MSDKFVVRAARFSDYRIITEYDEFIGDRRIDMQKNELLVCDYDGEIAVGYGRVTQNSFFDWPLLSHLCVNPLKRRLGIGSAIVGKAMDKYFCTRLYTSTEEGNLEMIALLNKVGATKIGHIDMLNFDEEREFVFRLV